MRKSGVAARPGGDGEVVREEAFGELKGYMLLKPFSVTASDYGAPTTRRRVLFIGYLPDEMNPLTVADFASKTVRTVTVADGM